MPLNSPHNEGMNLLPQEIQTQLSPGEQVLWSGQPQQGVVLRGSDAYAIPFSLMWGGFAIVWEALVISSNAPTFFILWGIPFVLVGIYLIAGRFFADARQRANTFYAVTNERILIVSGLFTRTSKSIRLSTLADIVLTEGKDHRGTITFGSESPLVSMFGGISGWPGMNRLLGPRFDRIENARAVHDLVRNAQREVA